MTGSQGSDGPTRALLDTSVLISFDRLRVAEVADEVAISAVTIGALQYGINAARDPLEGIRRRRRVEVVLDLFEILPFDTRVAEYYGALAALVRRQGRNPRLRRLDLQIAATAARHDLPLLTHNAADFAGLTSVITVIDLKS